MALRLSSATFFVCVHFIVLLFLSLVSCDGADSSAPTLLFVAELCRHGDRPPLKTFPSSPLSLENWPEGMGQLTAIGQRAHFELGQRIRRRYVDELKYLSPSYNQTELYVRSSDVDRTLMSAYSQLHGLYPPGTASLYDVGEKFGATAFTNDQVGLPGLIQTIPVHTESAGNDMMLLPGRNCERHDQLLVQKTNSKEYTKKLREEKEFFRKVGAIAGVEDVDSFSLRDVERINDNWKIYEAHSIPLQPGVTKEIREHAEELSNWYLTFINKGVENNRLRTGLILNTVREHMALSILNDLKQLPEQHVNRYKKFLFLSAHDTTVAATLSSLKIFDGVYPPYNSTIFWHLWKYPDNQLYVTIEYNDKMMQIPGCSSTKCPLKEYEKATKAATVYGPEMRKMECMIGLQRYSARFFNWISGKSKQNRNRKFLDLSTFNDGPGGSESSVSASSNISLFLASLCSTVAVIAAVSIWRIRTRYRGYVSAASDVGNNDIAALQSSEKDPLSSQRILT